MGKKVNKQCPWCYGTGKAQDPKSTWEMLNGGLCEKCHGKGQVEEWVDVKEPARPRSSSSSSGGDGGIAMLVVFIIVASLVLFAIVLAFTFLPILLGGYLLLTGWKSNSKSLKIIWIVSCFAVPFVFGQGWIGFLDTLKEDWSWINSILALYYPLGLVGLVVVAGEALFPSDSLKRKKS